jgi:hypothetical protein
MRTVWNLPPENLFTHSGKDWLQILLDQVDALTRSRILMIFWRAWYLRNDIVHQEGKETIENSVSFLISYNSEVTSLQPMKTDRKGKKPVIDTSQPSRHQGITQASSGWTPPPAGWIKLNSDASLINLDAPGGAGAVARNNMVR